MLNNQKTYNINQLKTRFSNAIMVLCLELSNECELTKEEEKNIFNELVKLNEWMNESDDNIAVLMNIYTCSVFKIMDVFSNFRNITFYDVSKKVFNIINFLHN
jgi:hypothetical protein